MDQEGKILCINVIVVKEEDIMVIEFSELGRIETGSYNYLQSLKLRSDFFFGNMLKDLQEG
ncbi:hypothetical protein Syun_019175 [Stephania yunnanensis]|uniref:Uncharacterized protein n=1 Tax=Stephania yunnanensis TaxID=152371 RepID=A0AAP0ITL6_9MAGN